MASYLQAFRDRVRKAHRDPDKYCHWNMRDELSTELSGGNHVKGGLGLCDCPSHTAAKTACSPHKCHSCASTSDVLAITTEADTDYNKELEAIS